MVCSMYMTKRPQSLSIKLSTLPKKPGVYIFRDAKGNVLYVGKAKVLFNRVKSYFQNNAALEERKRIMVTEIADLETIITKSEPEALLLEATMIKKENPPYNVILKDDKYFLYIRVTLHDDFPTVDLVRKVTNKKDAYFGPFTSAFSARETVKLLKRIFKFRTCEPNQDKPCFDYTINRCLGVCIGAVKKEEYRKMILQLVDFLRGKGEGIVDVLKKEMKKAAERQSFEFAATIRDRVQALEKVLAHQNVISPKRESFDILAIAMEHRIACVALLQVRLGKLLSKQSLILSNKTGEPESSVMQAFISQYYSQSMDVPRYIFCDVLPQESQTLEKTFSFHIRRPQRGDKMTLSHMAHDNAAQGLSVHLASFEKNTIEVQRALEKIQKAFKLSLIPKRIESYDIANISGVHATGSMVVFINGRPEKKLYKKFTIKTVVGANDPAMMAEVLSRRVAHLNAGDGGWEKPDLIILDGGKGQLSVVLKTLGPKAKELSIVALAKGGHQKPTELSDRELFIDARGHEMKLPNPSAELFLLERIRDEAHRFATTFYKGKHAKAQVASKLDDIEGIGPSRKRALLRHFGSVDAIQKASHDQLSAIVGDKMADAIERQL